MSPDGPLASSRASRVRERWAAAVAPRPDGLPNARVIALPLLVLAVVFIGLSALGLTGTSTGTVHSLISFDADPDLIAGNPQPVRSDEWFVQTSWTISQVEQSLPLRNEAFPGGMDATVQHDLPTTDWSTAFRPHLVGFLFLPLDQAMAVKWWLPAFAMIAAGFLFTVMLLPRRPIASLGLAIAFFFSPFFQWWYLSITFYPPAWAFLVMASVIWCLRTQRGIGRWILGALLAYLTVALGTGIYVPFIIPAVIVALCFTVGAVAMRGAPEAGLGARLGRLLPVYLAGVVGAAVLAAWVVTRWSTIVGFTSTVYPGERLQQVGNAGVAELGALLSGVFSFSLEGTQGAPFAPNSSEASTFILPGLFLIAALIWLVVERLRAGRGVDWLSIGVLAAGAIMLAFLFLPGWDVIAHLSLLDRTTYGRLRLGFGLMSFVMIVLVSMRIGERHEYTQSKVPIWVPLVSGAIAATSIAIVVWVVSRSLDLAGFAGSTSKRAIVVGLAMAVLLILCTALFSGGRFGSGVAVLLIMSIVSSAGVNPVYRGVLDLRSTETVGTIEELNAARPGEWVGINSTYLPTMMLVESGVSSFNGFQSSPSQEMWDEIDPRGEAEDAWNRLANVSWVAGEGDPAPRNPAPDQIQMTFDSCSAFARENVTWVLAEIEMDQACLSPVAEIEEGPTTMRIYEVVPAGG